jgi:hypothetical protein
VAAPTVSTRTIPTGLKLPDGYQSTISFASKPGIKLWERNLAWPGIDGGDPINITTMLNVAWRTFGAKKLKTLSPFTVNVAYDPDVYPDILALINLLDSITFHFPTAAYLCFYGYARNFMPQELQEGEFPMAAMNVVPTNYDPVNHVEAAPVYSATAPP